MRAAPPTDDRPMNTRALLIIGLSSVAVSVMSGAWSFWESTSRSRLSSTDVPWPDSEDYVRVQVQWPRTMEANESAWVTVAVVAKGGTQIPELSSSASGASEEVVMTTSLVGPTFDIKDIVADPQLIKGRAGLAWSWIITPKFAGQQALAARLYIERRSSGGGAPIDRRFFFGDGTIVSVRNPVAVAQVTSVALITGAIGILLSLPRAVDALLTRLEHRSRKRSASK